MNKKEMAKFFEDNWGLFDLKEIALAPWNYKKDDEGKAGKLKAKLERNNQVVNVNIREFPKGEERDHKLRYEVIDGNHRHTALSQLGYETVIAVNWGEMSRAEAIRLAHELNEGDFEPDPFKVTENFKELLESFSAEDLELTLPQSSQEIEDLAAMTDFDFDQFDDANGADTDGESDFVKMQFVVPKDAKEVIESAIDHLTSLHGINHKDEEVRRGLALELMAAHASGVEEGSLK